MNERQYNIMSYPLAHFVLGATISLLIFRLIDRYSGEISPEDYFRFDILIAVMGGFWAMIPDIPYLFDILKHAFKGGFCDIFFLHCTLDKLDTGDSPIVPAFLFILFFITVGALLKKPDE